MAGPVPSPPQLPWTERSGAVRIRVHVQPRSSRSRLVGVHAGSLKVQLHAPPADGAANQELIRLLADCLGVAKGSVRILQGLTARDKLVEVETGSPGRLIQRLRGVLGISVDNQGGGD